MHVQKINGREIRWEMVDRGHWRWARWDIKRTIKGQPSAGLIVEYDPRNYPAQGIEWWIYENGRKGPKPCRSLEHAQRAVRNRIEGTKRGGRRAARGQ